MGQDQLNYAGGEFGLARRRGLGRQDWAAATAVAALVCLAGAQLTTQWLASALGHQRALGSAYTSLLSVPVYAPWRALVWKRRLPIDSEGMALQGYTDAGLRVSAAFGLVAAAAMLRRRWRTSRNRAMDVHGTAHFATREEVVRAGLLHETGVVLGQWEDKARRSLRWLRSDGPEHVLLIAPSGSGKDVGPVLSTLLSCRESVFVLDPKGESFALTSGWRSTFSRVLKVDFLEEPGGAARFNALAEVRLGTSREVADVQRIAQSLVRPNGEPQNSSEAGDYFAITAASLLAGAILHVLYREQLRGRVACLSDVARELSDPTRPHGQVLNEWLSFEHAANGAGPWMDGDVPTRTHPIVAASAREQKNRSDKERSPILSTAVAALALYRDPLVAANTSACDFRIRDLQADTPVSLYLINRNADEERLKPIIRLLIDMVVRRLTEDQTFRRPGEPAPQKPRLLFMLNEFARLGRLNAIDTALATARGWGLRFVIVVQDYEQLVAAYGRNETISSNTPIRVAYAPNKIETAKLLSAWAGVQTIRRRTESKSHGQGFSLVQRTSEAEQEVKRELVTPDECMRLPGPTKDATGKTILSAGDLLVFAAGHAPIYAKQALYFLDATLVARARLDPAKTPSPQLGVRERAAATPTSAAPARSAIAVPNPPGSVATSQAGAADEFSPAVLLAMHGLGEADGSEAGEPQADDDAVDSDDFESFDDAPDDENDEGDFGFPMEEDKS